MKKGFFKALVATAVLGATMVAGSVAAMAAEAKDSWSADDLATGGIIETITLGTQFTFVPADAKGKSKVSTNGKVFADGTTFAQRLQIGGKSNLDKDLGYFTLTAPSAGTLSVYAVTGSNTDARDVELYDSSNNKLASYTSGPIEDANTYEYPTFVFDIDAAGTYKIASTGAAVNYYGMTWVASGSEEPSLEAGVVAKGKADGSSSAVVYDGSKLYVIGLCDKATEANELGLYVSGSATAFDTTDTVYTSVTIGDATYTAADLTGVEGSDAYVYGVVITDAEAGDVTGLNGISLK